jgi:uncharacterized Rmd1/YagE family protein
LLNISRRRQSTAALSANMSWTMHNASLITQLSARALLLGDRIDTTGLEQADIVAASPVAFRANAGLVVLYRFGVAVLFGLSALEEDGVLRQLAERITGGRARVHDESVILEIAPDREDKISPGGSILLGDLSDQRLLIVADVLSKTVALGRDEREVNGVLDVVEPFARLLAEKGRPPFRRRRMLKLIGNALLVQHRLSGRVAVEEKPDVLWDRPDLERLYARLEDEYELQERAAALQRKLDLVVETGRALTEIIDTDRATRLEATIVILIIFEILITIFQLWFSRGSH